jgi:hypothetical protein
MFKRAVFDSILNLYLAPSLTAAANLYRLAVLE